MVKKIWSIMHKLDLAVYKFFSKKRIKRIGENIQFNGKATFVEPQNLCIGDNCSLNHDVYINAINPIVIGNNVTISAGAKIISTGIDIEKWALTGKKEHITNEGIVIGNNVWIGAGATVLDSVKILGEFVVVAANAVVTKDVMESYCVVAGCPAKIIKTIDVKESK